MFLLLALLILFQIKHYLADYKMQGEYMLGKFKAKGWILPLSAHCFVHASFTFVFSSITMDLQVMTALALFDFLVHFAMDRIKASPNMWGRYKPISAEKYVQLKHDMNTTEKVGTKEDREIARDRYEMAMSDNRNFWLCLGIDQMVHHITHYLIIFVILIRMI
jgi:hypothetical protein